MDFLPNLAQIANGFLAQIGNGFLAQIANGFLAQIANGFQNGFQLRTNGA
jgi:hypothetical protein